YGNLAIRFSRTWDSSSIAAGVDVSIPFDLLPLWGSAQRFVVTEAIEARLEAASPGGARGPSGRGPGPRRNRAPTGLRLGRLDATRLPDPARSGGGSECLEEPVHEASEGAVGHDEDHVPGAR